MKKIAIALFVLLSSIGVGQNKNPGDSLGLPGDNLNLYAVLDALRESETLDAFEKKLNEENSKINNLDLNNDDKTDYIKVLDSKEGNSHLITLQVDVSAKEKQDIAVITVDKDDKGNTKVQVVGDPELYGKDYIIEPNDGNAGKKQVSSATPNKSNKTSDTTVSADGKTVIINNTVNNYYNNTPDNNTNDDYKPVPPVNQWVIVHHIYSPTYVVYSSPWYWGYYPGWWSPWRPLFWHHYYWGFHHHHFHHHHYYFNHAPFCYSKSYAGYYGQRRSVSAIYAEKKQAGTFKNTYSRPDLGKPKAGRPNPGYNGPVKNPAGRPNYNTTPKGNMPTKNNTPRQGVKTGPPQKMGPKPMGAPMQKSGGSGGGGGGRRR